MRIDSKAKIADLPILRVRDALKRMARRDWTADRLQGALGAEAAEVAAVLAALEQAGYVEPGSEPGSWRTTPEGPGVRAGDG